MLRWTRIAAFAVLVVTSAAMTSGAGVAADEVGTAGGSHVAGAAVGDSNSAAARRLALLRTADLSTRAGAWRYLRAIGLEPRQVVIQRGARNYAGPKCPGKLWTCSTARHVLQIGRANIYFCAPRQSGTAPNDCVIVQSGGGTAACTETGSANGATQKCSITQTNTATGANNNAIVVQILTQTGGQSGTQVATQNASIVQSNTRGGSNIVGVTQNVVQLLGRGAAALNDDPNDADDFTPATSLPITQKQDAYQRLSVMQTTSNSTGLAGNNTSGVLQTQLQRARADRSPQITQLQNTIDAVGTEWCPVLNANVTIDDPFANQCNTIQQSSSSNPGGKNTSLVRQDYRQFQAASNCCATLEGHQAQGSLTDPSHGGLDHRFTQASSGLSTQTSNQVERQVQRRSSIGAAGIDAEQHGPTRKGTGTQTGNAGDTATQTQSSVQLSTPTADVDATNLISDRCTSAGNCTGTQTVNSNGDVTTNTQSGSTITIAITCTPGESCTPTSGEPPPEGSIVIPAGGSESVERTFTVPTKPASADIEIAIDTTGSMGPSIAQAKTDAANIVSGVQAAIPDSQFAVVDFKDSFDATEYRVAQSMTSNSAAVQTALNGLSASGGGDLPEAYNLVFQNSYTPATGGAIGWRAGTRKFVVVIGDAEPHGANSAGFSACSDTSADPHLLNTATELAGMNSNQRTLFMILASTGSATLACYQSLAAAAFAGGQGVAAGTNLATQIVNLINAATSTVSNVHLEVASFSPEPAAASWISFNPTSVGPVTPPLDLAFTITITVPAGTPPGTYNFDIVGLADGADIGHEALMIFVPAA